MSAPPYRGRGGGSQPQRHAGPSRRGDYNQPHDAHKRPRPADGAFERNTRPRQEYGAGPGPSGSRGGWHEGRPDGRASHAPPMPSPQHLGGLPPGYGHSAVPSPHGGPSIAPPSYGYGGPPPPSFGGPPRPPFPQARPPPPPPAATRIGPPMPVASSSSSSSSSLRGGDHPGSGRQGSRNASLPLRPDSSHPPPLPSASATPPPPPPASKPKKEKKERRPDTDVPPPFPNPDNINPLLVAYVDSLRRVPPPAGVVKSGPKKRSPQITYTYEVPDEATPEIVKCTITLPAESNAKCKVVVGPPAEKARSRALAASEALHELWRAREVNDSYLSEVAIQDPEYVPPQGTENAALYKMHQPGFWAACEANLAKGSMDEKRTWYPTLLTLPYLPPNPAEPDAPPPDPLRPLLFFTPVPLPKFSDLTPLNLFPPHSTTAYPVTMTPLPAVELDTAQHAMADHYTRRLLRSVLNRGLILEEGKLLLHLIVPPTAKLDAVDWDEVMEAQGDPYEKWDWANLDVLERQTKDAMTTGKNEFSRRFKVKALRKDLSPLSSPDDSPREKGFSSILEYIKKTSNKFNGLTDENQPLLEINKFPAVTSHLRSILDITSDDIEAVEALKAKVAVEQRYIIPEVSYKSTLHASTYQSALYLPSFLFRLTTLLQVFELKASLLGGTIREDLLLRALTTPAAGLEQDYEELEYAGDVVLKCMTSVYAFTMMPEAQEKDLSLRRVSLVNNRFLGSKLVESGLTAFVQGKEHTPRTWYPINMSRYEAKGPGHGVAANSLSEAVYEATHVLLGDKVCADVIEALIYAAFATGGFAAAWTFCRTIKLNMPQIESWSDFAKVKLPPSKATFPDHVRKTARDLEERHMKYRFKDVRVLYQALMPEHGNHSHFQRLEFLGDAVLDFLTINYLQERLPNASLGQLVLYKSNMVSNVTLAALAVELGLHRLLQYEKPSLWRVVEAYAVRIDAARQAELKAAEVEKRDLRIYWADLDAPKEIGDFIEALLGALMVDGGFSGEEPRQYFFDTLFKPFLNKYIRGLSSLPAQPTAILVELVNGDRCKALVIKRTRVPSKSALHRNLEQVEVFLHKQLLSSAAAETENYATRTASSAALNVIEKDPGLIARLCTCSR